MDSKFCINPDHPRYVKALKREASSWGLSIVEGLRKRRPRDHPIPKKYLARLIANDDTTTDWIRWFAENAGPFESALSLGSGSGQLEGALLKAGTLKRLEVIDISGDAVESFQTRANKDGYGHLISSRIGDLNFIEFPEKAYDLVIAHTSLHHVINLEHLLEQVRRSLKTENGFFLVHDYIGPNVWQWSWDTVEEVNKALELSRGRHPSLPIQDIKRPDPKRVVQFSPFESVRSEEILELLHAGFEPDLEIVTDRLLFIILQYGIQMPDWNNPELVKFLNEMIEWEDTLKEGSELAPYTVWGMYKPGKTPIPQGERWTEDEIKRRIGIRWWNPRGWVLRLFDKSNLGHRLAHAWLKFKRRKKLY